MAKERVSRHLDQLGLDIQKALGLEDKMVRRILIDIQPNVIPTLWVEVLADDSLDSIDWPERLKAVEITIGESTKEKTTWRKI